MVTREMEEIVLTNFNLKNDIIYGARRVGKTSFD
jgi:predicted AAA+ superfamily ATPase